MKDFNRRQILTGGIAAAMAAPTIARGHAATSTKIINPLVRNRADAQVSRAADGYYYMMATVPEYDRLAIRRSRTIAGLADALEAVVWRRPSSGRLGGYIWAPELHKFDGRWHIYFGAGDSDDKFHVRLFVLASSDPNPLTAKWQLLGQIETQWDTFTLDPTSFEHRGTRYLCWAQHEPGIDTNSNIYLAPLANPTTLAAKPARLSVPTYEWETRGFKVNEAPALLARNGRLFLTYSASATDANYCLGMLTADGNADIMNPSSWSKSRSCVFTSSPRHRVYGPGHNSFTVDEHGHDMLVYHARDYEKIVGDPLLDPNRHTRVQRIHYLGDGTPFFGEPVANGPLV